MAYSDAGLDAHLTGIGGGTNNRVSFHTADPGVTGASEISGTGRPATTWGAAEASASPLGRKRVGTQVAAPIPAATTVTHWGIWTAATGGTFLFGGALDAPEAFGSAGTLEHTPTLIVTN